MKTIVFDIETGPLPEAELAGLVPRFDPAEVKTGNLKDPLKIAEKLREAEADHRREFIERAALDPLTGRVVAIGWMDLEERRFQVIADEDEAAMLRAFWEVASGEMGRVNSLIGFNSHLFDLPFLIRRSWKHRVPVPMGIRRGRYWTDQMIDLRDAWQLGDRQARGSLDAVGRHLGVGGKNGDGGHFAALWLVDREKALAYLRNDIELTAKVAEGLGVAA